MRGSERRVGVYGRLNWHRILWRHGASSPSSSGNGGVKWWLCAVCYNEVLHLSQSCTSAFALNYTLLSFEFSWLINDGMNENGRSRFSTLDVNRKWSDSRACFNRFGKTASRCRTFLATADRYTLQRLKLNNYFAVVNAPQDTTPWQRQEELSSQMLLLRLATVQRNCRPQIGSQAKWM